MLMSVVCGNAVGGETEKSGALLPSEYVGAFIGVQLAPLLVEYAALTVVPLNQPATILAGLFGSMAIVGEAPPLPFDGLVRPVVTTGGKVARSCLVSSASSAR